ncbi:MAG: hypothetical protein A2289_25170 [Deltaproteobacteria bacterium RIFOXYA12_FULL_58_15]|nr:MAG: hypothetical protein A2289_25170 [Deltaproteobacteria bacterium RIFOXYA12_FULL_58_15]OGR13302.1 MAG: hypothetical protein A2341_16210 [Deltaproteobacteria bacterium RIFOXYB12_FULL_58_9]
MLAGFAGCGDEVATPPGADPKPKDPNALDALNDYREMMGLSVVVENAKLVQASQNHVDYFLTNVGVNETCAGEGISPHDEVSGCPGFTGEGPGERTGYAGYSGAGVAECMSFVNDGPQAIYGWLATVYHRLCIASPEIFEMGFAKGERSEGNVKVDVIEVGLASSADPSHIARWPVPDAMDVPKSWDGLENPLPPTPPDGYPSGPIVSVIYPPADDANISDATISDHTGDVASYFLSPEIDPNLAYTNAYFVYSHKPLTERRTYTVEFTGTRGGSAWNDSWSFYVPCERSMPKDGKACNGNTLLSCDMSEPFDTDCAEQFCIDYPGGARCVDEVVTCNQADGEFIGCIDNGLVYCLGGYQLVERDCGIDTCIPDGPHGPTCASVPITTCASVEQDKLRCEGDLLVYCELGYLQHRDCTDESLFCQVNSTGDNGFCAASQAPCSAGRCAGDVPIDCRYGWQVAEPICPTGTCAVLGNNASCRLPPCEDGDDNDNDGWTDDADPDCAGGDDEVGFGVTECNDDVNNDTDEEKDSADPECSDASDNDESA